MIVRPRNVVGDTNVAVSAVFGRLSIPGKALHKLTQEDKLLLSPSMKAEWIEVFHRSKFDRQISLERRLAFLYNLFELAVPVTPTETVTDCVDPKDNMILECALAGRADIILTGDDHLLRLHPWRGIAIIKPLDYLALKPGEGLR